MRCPPNRTSPALTLVTPRIVLRRVDRPEPFAPTTVSHSPAPTVRSTSKRTGSRPYPARMPRSSSIGPHLLPRLVVLAEVDGPHLRIGGDLVGAPGGDDPPPGEDVDQVTVLEHRLDVVLDEQHGQPQVLLQLADEGEQRLRLGGVEPGGGFVEQEQAGAGEQAPADLDPALGPEVEVADELVPVAGHVEQLGHRPGRLLSLSLPGPGPGHPG